jgi:hypothetical protein
MFGQNSFICSWFIDANIFLNAGKSICIRSGNNNMAMLANSIDVNVKSDMVNESRTDCNLSN